MNTFWDDVLALWDEARAFAEVWPDAPVEAWQRWQALGAWRAWS